MKSVLIVIFIETTNMDKKVEIEPSVLFWLLTEFEAHFDSNVIINYPKYVFISHDDDGPPSVPLNISPQNNKLAL